VGAALAAKKRGKNCTKVLRYSDNACPSLFCNTFKLIFTYLIVTTTLFCTDFQLTENFSRRPVVLEIFRVTYLSENKLCWD
jgi:hypothetical protein